MTDKELIERIINKDGKAFKELVQRYEHTVFKTCIGFLHNKEEAEELTQDVFVEVYQSIERFRQEAKLSTWLYRVSVNKSLNYLKKTKKERAILSLESFVRIDNGELRIDNGEFGSEHGETRMDNEEKAMMLEKSLDSLPPNQKIAFTLNKYDEMAYKDIAEVMDMSVSSVESLIHRAKLNLQKKLFDYFKKSM